MYFKTLVYIAATLMLAALPVQATQVLVQDIEAKGKISKDVADALAPLVEATLAESRSLTVISENDIRALLKHEEDKQRLGCADRSCMADIANTMGAELLAKATISRFGQKYVAGITIFRVSDAEVLSKVKGVAQGGEEAALTAMERALKHFQKKYVPEVNEATSLTKRAFEAALIGLVERQKNGEAELNGFRKRVMSDLVDTELDYDAAPKLKLVKRTAQRLFKEASKNAMLAVTEEEFTKWIDSRLYAQTLFKDVERITEMRARARESGRQISTQSGQFGIPEYPQRLKPSEVKKIVEKWKEPRQIVEDMIESLKKRDKASFARHFGKRRAGAKVFERLVKKYDTLAQCNCEIPPDFVIFPEDYERQRDLLERPNEVEVYIRDYASAGVRPGPVDVRMKRIRDQWLVTSWE